jgi:hypothetical protein
MVSSFRARNAKNLEWEPSFGLRDAVTEMQPRQASSGTAGARLERPIRYRPRFTHSEAVAHMREHLHDDARSRMESQFNCVPLPYQWIEQGGGKFSPTLPFGASIGSPTDALSWTCLRRREGWGGNSGFRRFFRRG